VATPLRRIRIRADYGRGRKAQNASAWLDTLETRYAEHKAHTGRIMQAMQHEGSGDGRSSADHESQLVNAMEVRHSERWLQDRAASVAWPTPWSDECTSIMPDGTRSIFTPPEPEPMPERMAATVAAIKAEAIADAADNRGARRRY